MQARSYQCIEPFDDCISQLRAYFKTMESSQRKPMNRARKAGISQRRRKTK
jgi:hypothetical protein